MKKLFNILIFVSFIFLFIYLIRQDLIIAEIPDLTWLIISVFFVFAGFYVSTISWQVALESHGKKISHRDAIVSHGQAIFAKYIPGKIWVILGRAGYISNGKEEMKNSSFVSMKEQLIYIWAGLVISAIPTFIYYKFQWISFLLIGIIILLSLMLFSAPFHRWGLGLFKRIFKKELELPVISFKKSFPIILSTSGIWLFWTVGFFIFMLAFSEDIMPVMAFAFPLSVSFGVLAIILPGGLGVREGIIVGYLTLAGLDVETATTISFMNRLWFIAGEVFIFLLSLLLRVGKKPRRGNRSI
ncbi:lysylphosphatidylglycerol synthase domain-containing protein [Bacteroidota bacterium]